MGAAVLMYSIVQASAFATLGEDLTSMTNAQRPFILITCIAAAVAFALYLGLLQWDRHIFERRVREAQNKKLVKDVIATFVTNVTHAPNMTAAALADRNESYDWMVRCPVLDISLTLTHTLSPLSHQRIRTGMLYEFSIPDVFIVRRGAGASGAARGAPPERGWYCLLLIASRLWPRTCCCVCIPTGAIHYGSQPLPRHAPIDNTDLQCRRSASALASMLLNCTWLTLWCLSSATGAPTLHSFWTLATRRRRQSLSRMHTLPLCSLALSAGSADQWEGFLTSLEWSPCTVPVA